MFNRIKWGAYAPYLLSEPNVHDILRLEKLIKLCFPTASIDTTSQEAKRLLRVAVITIEDGQDSEEHGYYDLIYHKLPYILFSNNKWYIKGYRSQMLQARNPLDMLCLMTEQYHQRFLRKTNFHL